MPAQDTLNLTPTYEAMLRAGGFTAASAFDERVKAWRTLADRENCTLDWPGGGGRIVRFHIKRFPAVGGFATPAEDEARGIRLLEEEGIGAAPLAAWGKLADGRSFVMTEDLAGFQAADKAVEGGVPFASLLNPIADTAASLHAAGLHHRDLYLCHFFVKMSGPGAEAAGEIGAETAVAVRLIDAARVARLPGILTRQRWIVKDLAELWFSTLKLPIADAQRDALLTRYCRQRRVTDQDRLKRSIELKVRWIAAHDKKLNEREPTRNISIPDDEDA